MDIESDILKKPQNLSTCSPDENLDTNIAPKHKQVDLVGILRNNFRKGAKAGAVALKSRKRAEKKKSESKYFVLDEDIKILSLAFFYQKHASEIVLKTLIDELCRYLQRSRKSVIKRFEKIRFLNDSQKYLLVSYYEKYKRLASIRRIMFHKNEVDAVLVTTTGAKPVRREQMYFDSLREESYGKKFSYTLREEKKVEESEEEDNKEYIPHGLLVDGCFSVEDEEKSQSSEEEHISPEQYNIDPTAHDNVISIEDIISCKEEGEVELPRPAVKLNSTFFEIDEPSLVVQACLYRPRSFYTSKDILNVTFTRESVQPKKKRIEKRKTKKKPKKVYMHVDLDEFIKQGHKLLRSVFVEKKVLGLEQLLESDNVMKDGRVNLDDIESRFDFDRHASYLSN